MFNKTKNAFTLAEVLITLVIIGIVAALTIPTAINKYKEEELKSQFKKAYSTLSQAVNKTFLNDFYGYADCYMGGSYNDCKKFYDAMAKNLNVSKICRGNALSKGCLPVFQKYTNEDGNCDGWSENRINNHAHVYVLSDGTIIIPYWFSNAGGAMQSFLVDINGQKAPNAYGKDLFGFSLLKNTDNTVYPGACTVNCGCRYSMIVSGGRHTEDMIKYALIKQ